MKLRIATPIFLITLLLCPIGQAAGTTSPERTKDVAIRELLEITGAGKLGIQVMNQMLPGLKKIAPEIPDEFWNKFMSSTDPKELVDIVVPVYAKHFSLDDIEQIIAFYKSKAGQKYVQELPALMQEAMAAGQEWGQGIGQRAVKEIQAERAKHTEKQSH